MARTKQRLTVQRVTAILRAAGFESSIRSRHDYRRGYSASQKRGGVTIMADHAPEGMTCREYSDRMQGALEASGLRVARPFPDTTIIGVTE